MKCGIITSVGPLDERAHQISAASIANAIASSMGPFTSVLTIPVRNLERERSWSDVFNRGVEQAVDSDCEWIFYLDAGDLLFVDAFKSITDLTSGHDAIWGLICEAPDASLQQAKLHDHQTGQFTSIHDVLNSDPGAALASGFFMRTRLAIENKTKETSGPANEFLFFLNCWEKHRCIKGNFILSIELTGHKRITENSVNSPAWRAAAKTHIKATRRRTMALEIHSPEIEQRRSTLVFTIGALASDADQYDQMLESFSKKGFSHQNSEFIYVDHSDGKEFNAYRALNSILDVAKGKYILLCQQDVRLFADDFDVLVERLTELDKLDPKWAVAGNSGGGPEGFRAYKITNAKGQTRSTGAFPARVFSLDENFIIVRRKNRVAFSDDVGGSHFYGTDICVNADIVGYSAYVINFNLIHLNEGEQDLGLFDAKKAFERKWSAAIRPRTIQTTHTIVDMENVAESQKGWSGKSARKNSSIFQIFYDEATRAQVAPEFIPLDNTKNLRQDWFEFEPIREALANMEMRDDHFYGFLSPKFSSKTGFRPCDVMNAVNAAEKHIDVILLSAHPHDLAVYKNPFIQGDRRHAGLLPACEYFFDIIGKPINLKDLVTTLENSVFSNYVIAKPRYWRKWLVLTDAFFEFAENKDQPWFDKLNQRAQHREGDSIHLKVFAQERLATFLLATESFNVSVPDFFRKFKNYDNEVRAGLIYMENLKKAYVESGDSRFLKEYEKVRASGKIQIDDVHDLSHVLAGPDPS